MNFELFKDIKTRYFFIELLSVLVLGLIVLIVLGKIFHVPITESYVQVSALLITIVQFMLVLRFMGKNNIGIGSFIRKPSKKKFIFELPVTLIITYTGSIGLILIMLYLAYCINPNVLESLKSSFGSKAPQMTSTFIAVLSFVSAVIVAPVTEEFIFRGILMNRLFNKYGKAVSIIGSSLIFFIMHINPNPMLICLGISCAFLVYKYKSLIPSIMLHSCNNFIVSVRDYGNTNVHASPSDFTINSSFLILGSILFIIYILYLYVSFRKYRIAA